MCRRGFDKQLIHGLLTKSLMTMDYTNKEPASIVCLFSVKDLDNPDLGSVHLDPEPILSTAFPMSV